MIWVRSTTQDPVKPPQEPPDTLTILPLGLYLLTLKQWTGLSRGGLNHQNQVFISLFGTVIWYNKYVWCESYNRSEVNRLLLDISLVRLPRARIRSTLCKTTFCFAKHEPNSQLPWKYFWNKLFLIDYRYNDSDATSGTGSLFTVKESTVLSEAETDLTSRAYSMQTKPRSGELRPEIAIVCKFKSVILIWANFQQIWLTHWVNFIISLLQKLQENCTS